MNTFKTFVFALAAGAALLPAQCLNAQTSQPAHSASRAQTWDLSDPPLVPADQLPRFGNFWRLSNLNWPPTPCLPPELAGFPVYALPQAGWFLVDDGAATSDSTARSELDAASGLTSSLLVDTPAAGSQPRNYPAGSLWMELTFSNAVPWVTLHGTEPTNVYAILSKADLMAPEWTIETTVHGATNQNFSSTPLSTDNRTNMLFLWARNWTGVDANANGMPDWYEWENFGGPQPADGDYDGDGASNLNEYLAGADPNTISFQAAYTNDFVNTGWVNGAAQVQNGVPAQMAFLVDATNFSGAVWQAYTPNFAAPLPPKDGRYWVWVGLRGRAPDSKPVWKASHISRDTVPPVVILTNIAPGIVSQPMIQLQGYCPESLASLRFDVVNGARTLTNLEGSIISQCYDPVQGILTTNFFQLYDIDLTNGINTITLRARDLAGNETVTNFVFTLMSDADAPNITLGFPRDGASLAGDTFDLQGQLDDATASVTVCLTNLGSVTNTYKGVIERNGRFWAQSLPLLTGVTSLGVTATDAWGNSASTNLTVTRSGLSLTLSPVDANQLYQNTISLSGTVGDPSYDVWVNGVEAAVDESGNWQADGVPVNHGGTASFTISATPPRRLANLIRPVAADDSGDGDGDEVDAQANLDKPDRCYVETDSLQIHEDYDLLVVNEPDWWEHTTYTYDSSYTWHDADGGSGTENYSGQTEGSDYPEPSEGGYTATLTWTNSVQGVEQITPVGSDEDHLPDQFGIVFTPAMSHCDENGTVDLGSIDGYGNVATGHYARITSGQTTIAFQAGGKSLAGKEGVLIASASARNILDPMLAPPFRDDYPSQSVAPEQISIAGLGSLDSTGAAYGKIASGDKKVVTPKPPGDAAAIGADAHKVDLCWLPSCIYTTGMSRKKLGIGEPVTVMTTPPTAADWSVTGDRPLNQTNTAQIGFSASQSPGSANVTAKIGTETLSVNFTIVPPDSIQVVSNWDAPLGSQATDGSAMGARTLYQIIVGPTDVSFGGAQLRENLAPLNVTWPNGTSSQVVVHGATNGFSVACDHLTEDDIRDGFYPASYLYNGTNFADFSYTYKWEDEYKNEQGNWISFKSMETKTEYRGSDRKCRQTYLGTSGGWQGPYAK